jgi:LPXTG-motif cell wall-anchored protein
MARLLALFLGVSALLLVSALPASAQTPSITITSPTNGARVAGPDVTVTINVTGTTLVPAADATKLEDMHVHYLLDVDPAPYLSGATAIPMGNPNIVHTAALSQTFSAVAPGTHRVAVVLGLSNHTAAQPPVAPSVSFTVAGAQAPTQLPRTGDIVDPVGALAIAGAAGIALGILLRRRQRPT